ncbi:MAG: response regulator [Kiritimatiellae bacterium]|nr:response regulator [Kiritimatiellia bacterium]
MQEKVGGAILVIEDHKVMRKAMCDVLQDVFPECEVLCAATGEEGLSLAMRHRPLVVITDLCLPGLTGIDVTCRIKTLWPATGVVICTLSDGPTDRKKGEDAGVDEWVSKAEGVDALQAAVGRCLTACAQRMQRAGSTRGASPPTACHGNWKSCVA